MARSLYIAGKALQREDLKQYALEAFREIFKCPQNKWHLPGPTFCHGIAVLLTITTIMAQETHDEDLKEKVTQLEALLLGYYNEQFPFGFRDLERMRGGGYAQLDRIGILEGATGVLLSLLSVHTPSRHWRLPFLIDGVL